jgi:hypothetical protein
MVEDQRFLNILHQAKQPLIPGKLLKATIRIIIIINIYKYNLDPPH